jgi:hypothetical protein
MSLNHSFIVELARHHSLPLSRLLDFGCGSDPAGWKPLAGGPWITVPSRYRIEP